MAATPEVGTVFLSIVTLFSLHVLKRISYLLTLWSELASWNLLLSGLWLVTL